MLNVNGAMHTHDCDGCEYLGTIDGPDPYSCGELRVWDLYHCAKCDEGTVIARYGSEGSQYCSMPLDIARRNRSHPTLQWAIALLEAKERHPTDMRKPGPEKCSCGGFVNLKLCGSCRCY